MRVLVALDTSDVGESAAVAIGAWSRSVQMEVHLLSVVHPKDLHAREESSFTGEFSTAEDIEPGHIPLIESGQYGGVVASTSTNLDKFAIDRFGADGWTWEARQRNEWARAS